MADGVGRAGQATGPDRTGWSAVRVLVVYAHPADDSFVAHLRDLTVRALGSGGHQLDVVDLYGDGFDPLDPTGERAHGNPDATPDDPGCTWGNQRGRLERAEGLVLVHPTWWGGQPAILKGWFDGVVGDLGPPAARPGSAGDGRPLGRIRRLAVVTTHGSARWVNHLQGEPGRCTTMRALRTVLHPHARRQWLACYGLDRIGPADRARFAARVSRVLARW
jgi:putative NADPH-quinone reductase